MNLQEHLTAELTENLKPGAQIILCADGAGLSVQASSLHYSTPRSDVGPYSHVEVGYPTVSPPESWAKYCDGDWEGGDHTKSVYGYVPIELVEEFIEEHGGKA